MKRIWCLILFLVLLLLAACGPEPVAEQSVEVRSSATVELSVATQQPTPIQIKDTPQPTPMPPTHTPIPAVEQPTEVPPTPAEVAEPTPYPGLSLPTVRGELFSASGACAACHTQLVDEAGNDVSTDTHWRASMMANAARDPYWQASVRSEVLTHADLQAVIEDKCAACHMPMARFAAISAGEANKVLDDGFLDPEHELHSLALDGISCTLCHQIQEDGLGEQESFSSGFLIDAELPSGEREAFGPHPVEEDLDIVMQGSSGFVPAESLHIEDPALCATCHTLYTPHVDAEGHVAGEFPEQMAYFEWQASSFGDTVTCQGCHMPTATGGVSLSIVGGPLRSPFHQHIFAGGNGYMLEILQTFGDEINVTASSTQFQDKQGQALEQLQKRSASIAFKEVNVDGSKLTADIGITSMVGHKFPTGFPSRRVWIHLSVQDAKGQIVFESGAVNPDGSITGNDNDADRAAYEPHYQVVDDSEQVQIYESIMGDTEGQVTTTLLKGAGYLKDNRLPPAGFDKSTAQADIAVYGVASEDEDLIGGSDRIKYIMDLGEAVGPFTVTAELLYQSIGFRWADNLRGYDAPETARFLAYYEQVSNEPIAVATATLEVSQ